MVVTEFAQVVHWFIEHLEECCVNGDSCHRLTFDLDFGLFIPGMFCMSLP
jgi:hypothetical protein